MFENQSQKKKFFTKKKCCVSYLNFEDLPVSGTRCFKIPTQALFGYFVWGSNYLEFPTRRDSATVQDKGTEVTSLSRDKGTGTSSKSCHGPGRAGTGRYSLSNPGRGTRPDGTGRAGFLQAVPSPPPGQKKKRGKRNRILKKKMVQPIFHSFDIFLTTRQ